MTTEKALSVNGFITTVIEEYPLDQLALLVTWMNEADDAIAYFVNWCDLGYKVEQLIRECDIDLIDLIDDVMIEKRKEADEAVKEERDRYLDMNGLQ
ncbi:hypothetical protein IKF63_01190 [Candidatus Saccharibacteria bacterium]|nr:hypothetical protein [Candidatus Saccharibacteria bacterium]MBR3180677.1 hypothetical protein [Candidatus Saccharibacteria bacterium]